MQWLAVGGDYKLNIYKRDKCVQLFLMNLPYNSAHFFNYIKRGSHYAYIYTPRTNKRGV